MRAICEGVIMLLITSAAMAQEAPSVDLFGGYSYLHLNTLGLDKGNLNGWNSVATVNAREWLGVSVDVSGHYGSDVFPGNTLRTFSYLAGPQLTYRGGRASAFGRVLFGMAQHHKADSSPGATFAETQTAFEFAAGAGGDLRIDRRLAIRLLQIDYLRSQTFGSTQNNLRISAGLVFRVRES